MSANFDYLVARKSLEIIKMTGSCILRQCLMGWVSISLFRYILYFNAHLPESSKSELMPY